MWQFVSMNNCSKLYIVHSWIPVERGYTLEWAHSSYFVQALVIARCRPIQHCSSKTTLKYPLSMNWVSCDNYCELSSIIGVCEYYNTHCCLINMPRLGAMYAHTFTYGTIIILAHFVLIFVCRTKWCGKTLDIILFRTVIGFTVIDEYRQLRRGNMVSIRGSVERMSYAWSAANSHL